MRLLKKSGFFIETNETRKRPDKRRTYKGSERERKNYDPFQSMQKNLRGEKFLFSVKTVFLDAGANGKHRFPSDLNKLLRYVSYEVL